MFSIKFSLCKFSFLKTKANIYKNIVNKWRKKTSYRDFIVNKTDQK